MDKLESRISQNTQTSNKFPQINVRYTSQTDRNILKTLISTPTNQLTSKSSSKFRFSSPETSNFTQINSCRSAPSISQFDREKLRQLLIKTREEPKEKLLKAQGYQRDVSHMKDKPSIKYSNTPPEFTEVFICSPKPTQYLPINLDHLKTYVQNSDDLGLPVLITPTGISQNLPCKKDKCIQEIEIRTVEQQLPFKKAYEEFEEKKSRCFQRSGNRPFSQKVLSESYSTKDCTEDFVFLGAPSGRQEIQNLKEWYEFMKKTHLDPQLDKLFTISLEENPESILDVCNTVFQAGFRDLVRQVSVHCADRGELLREILNSFHDMWKLYLKRIQQHYIYLLTQKDQNLKLLTDTYDSEILTHNNENTKVSYSQLKEKLQTFKKELKASRELNKELNEVIYSIKKTNAQLDADLLMKERDGVRRFNKSNYHAEMVRKDERYAYARNVAGHKSSSHSRYKQVDKNNLQQIDSESYEEVEESEFQENKVQSNEKEISHDKYSSTKMLMSNAVQTDKFEYFNRETMTDLHMEDYVNSWVETDEEIRKSYFRDMGVGTESKKYMGMGRSLNVCIDSKIEMSTHQELSAKEEPKTKKLPKSRKRERSTHTDAKNTQILTLTDISMKELNRKSKTPKADAARRKKRVLKLPHLSASQKELPNSSDPIDPTDPILQPSSKPSTPHDSILPSLEKSDNLLYIDDFIPLQPIYSENKHEHTFIDTIDPVNTGVLINNDPDMMDELQIFNIISTQYPPSEITNSSSSPKSSNVQDMNLSKELSGTSNTLYEITEEENDKLDEESLITEYSDSPVHKEVKVRKRMKSERDLNKAEMIPAGVDELSWHAGYNTGYQYGKLEGEKISILQGICEKCKESTKPTQISESSEFEEFDKNFARASTIISSSNTQTFRQRQTRVNSTGVLPAEPSLKFASKLQKSTRAIGLILGKGPKMKKLEPSWKIIESILATPLEKLQTFSKLPKKMLYKLISYLHQSILIKYRTGEKLKALSLITYNEFVHKYGLRQVAEVKYKAFIISLRSIRDNRRIDVFCRLFGIGHTLEQPNFNLNTFKFYIDCFSYIIHSKVGIVTNLDETADLQMIPTARAIECVQQKTAEFMPESAISRIVSSLESSSLQDVKKMNPTGIIEQELVLEILSIEFEKYQNHVKSVICCLNDCLSAYPNAVCISQYHLVLIVRYILPHNSQIFFSISDDGTEVLKSELSRYVINLNPDEDKIDSTDNKGEVLLVVNKIVGFFVKKLAMRYDDYDNFVSAKEDCEMNMEIDRYRQDILYAIEKLEQYQDYLNAKLWKDKLTKLEKSMSEFETRYILGTFKIWKQEIMKFLG